MTMILNPDLDMGKMSHHTKHEGSILRHSKVIVQTDTQTDRQIGRRTHSDIQAV